MGRIDIEIAANDSGAVSAEERQVQLLEQIAQNTAKADDGTKNAQSSLSGLNSILGTIGVTVSAGAMVALASQLDQAGASANRVVDSFNTFTGGQADEYASRVQSAVHGLIDDEDALSASQALINYGLVQNSTQAAEMIKNATVLGAAFSNIGAKQASEDFALLLNTLSPRQMKEFGLGIDEVRGKTEALMAANGDLTQREATRQAIMELASSKAGQFSGVLDDQKAHLDALSVAWQDLGETMGKSISGQTDASIQSLTGMINNLSAATTAVADNRQAILAASGSYEEYSAALLQAGINEGINIRGGAAARAEYDAQRAVFVAARNAQIEATSAARDDATVHKEQAAAIDDASAKYDQLTVDVQKFNAALEQQAGIQLKTLENIPAITKQMSTQQGVFQTGIALTSQLNLSQGQSLQIYEQLGLATGQVSQKQIDLSAGLRQITNLYASGSINAKEYAKDLQDVSKAKDPVTASLKAISDAIMKTSRDAGTGALDIEDWRAATKNMSQAATGLPEQIDTLQAKLGKLAQPVTVNLDKSKIEAGHLAVDAFSKAFFGLNGKTIDVTINASVVGPGAPLVNGQGQ